MATPSSDAQTMISRLRGAQPADVPFSLGDGHWLVAGEDINDGALVRRMAGFCRKTVWFEKQHNCLCQYPGPF
jgi:hypothetical protein